MPFSYYQPRFDRAPRVGWKWALLCLAWADPLAGYAQVWVRDVREAVELLDEATGQRTPKEQVQKLNWILLVYS